MKNVTVAITAASYSGNKGAAAMLQSSISQLKERYGDSLQIRLMSVYPSEDRLQCPHAFVTIIPAQPQKVLCLVFPCAVLYRMFRWCAPLRAVLLNNEMLKTYLHTDLVIDEAGISFSDSRGFLLNTYSFACAAIPMLMGVPVVKYSQAMGPFANAYNRLLAKLALPEMKLVTARGRMTDTYLRSIGVRRQERVYADGAFTMPDAPAVEKRVNKICETNGFSPMAALSVSSVVERKCRKAGIDYCAIMAEFAVYLNRRGYQVFLLANAARMHVKKTHNNDLPACDMVAGIYHKLQNRENNRRTGPGSGMKEQGQADSARGLIWEPREMDAEEIRAWIGRCEFLVTSRFHAMVFALSKNVPVLLVGWSHKYQEVMEQFGLSEFAADYSDLSLEKLQNRFEIFLEQQEAIRERICKNLPAVKESSRKNIRHIVKILDEILAEKEQKQECQKGRNKECQAEKERKQKYPKRRNKEYQKVRKQTNGLEVKKVRKQINGLEVKKVRKQINGLEVKKYRNKQTDRQEVKPDGWKANWMNHVIDLNHPDLYMGAHLACGMGCSSDPRIRRHAASGGMVTALLISLLKNRRIDGAWVVKTAFDENGKLTYETGIATTPAQIRDASSSVYQQVPILSHLDELRAFDGRMAVVLTPCMMRAFGQILEKDQTLKEKIVLKIGLFCSGVFDCKAAEFAMDHYGIPRKGAKRLYYRRGHWRGAAAMVYEDGSQRAFSYTKSICAYKNAGFFIRQGCLKCKDQFASRADISFGDVWLGQVKKDAVKYTGYIVRSQHALKMLETAHRQGDIHIRPLTDQEALRSQMRALTLKYRNQRWNHRLAGWLEEQNRKFSAEEPDLLRKVPLAVVYAYMCAIRVLLSF